MGITRILLRSLLFSFIIGWVFLSFTYPPTLKDDEIEIWCSECQDPLSKLITTAIDQANKEIYLDIYSITEPQILKALDRAAKRGVSIEIFTDKKRHPKQLKLDPSIIQSSSKTTGLAHKKILIVDDKQLYLGSANFTYTSLKQDNNLIIGISHEEIAHFFSKKSRKNTFFFHGQTISCFSLPEDRKEALKQILEMIQTAEKTIEVALYTLSHPLLVESLIQAHKRGIKVTIYLDAHSARGICESTVNTLKAEKVPTYLGSSSKTLHHKYMVVDQKKMISGSCNWTKAAFSKNQEALLLIEPLNPKQKSKIKMTFKVLRTIGKKIARIIFM